MDHGSGGFRARSGCRYRARAVVVAGLVAVLACVVGCGGVFEPEPRYAATLKPCSLLPQRSVERLFEVDELAKPYTGKRFLDEWYGDVHCTWEYDLAWSELETGKLVPSERELAVELDVYDREEGGTPEADQTFDESLEKSDRTVGRIGEEAAWRYEGDPQDFGELWLRRANAIVTIRVSGADCCRDDGLERVLTERELRELAVAAASEVDRKLKSIR